jgi:hypothetical protein
MPSSAAQDAILSKAQADAVSQVRSGLRPEVKVLRSFAEVKLYVRHGRDGKSAGTSISISVMSACALATNSFVRT